MDSIELKISTKDWFYIVGIGGLFGFFISLFFYFLSVEFKDISTIYFGIFNAILITLFSFFFISTSNKYILPYISKKFWYIISFLFSFFSGVFGFSTSFAVFSTFGSPIADLVEPYSLYLTLTVGCLTFLIGLILHQFISMKYKNESIKTDILQAKIKTLENELNPHFLFNALNSMCELVYVDQQKAEKSLLNLAQFLRNAINKESLVTIKDELDMVRTYVEIENIRFADKINLVISLDENMKDTIVPKFSIQLLVENAIKHGYLNKQLNIIITVNKNIEVTNDGKQPEEIKFGTGLKNLKDRLELLNIGDLNYSNDKIVTFTIVLKDK
jgi:sensor histidine kinase YesM